MQATLEPDGTTSSDEDYIYDLQSVTSSVLEHEYENGRRYHGWMAGSYPFPNDEAEIERIEKLRIAMEEHPDERSVARYSRAEENFRSTGGYAAESEARSIGAGLGLDSTRLDRPTSVLSGGERRRVEIARILFAGSDVHGATLGILGMGRIGQAIARRGAHGFGMKVIYHNRSPLDAATAGSLGARYVSREALLREADHLVIVVPYSADSHHLIGAAELALMKPTAFVINVARGGLIDEEALHSALTTGVIAGAGLDVFTSEQIESASGSAETAQMIESIAPSFNFPRPTIADGTDSVRPATLRTLGPDHVLVLINGKRRHSSALVYVNGTIGRGAQSVDLNAIPSSAIEKIEVLRDGAAAQYGSDAIAGVINIVPGDGPTTGAYLVQHHGVDKVAFTGSTKTGGEIMRLCSDPIKRLTLELGGKSPNLVFADADLADALPASAWAIYYSAGQSCEARSRLLVESSIYDDVVNQMTGFANAVKDLPMRTTAGGMLYVFTLPR